MEFSRITTDKRIAGKAVWVIYTFASIAMEAMAIVSGWPAGISAALAIHWVVLTFLTFYPKSSTQLQPILMMLFSFGNVYMCSLAEGNIYPGMPVTLGATIILVVYRSEGLLLSFSLLNLAGILSHLLFFHTVPLDTPLHIFEFVVRVSIMVAAQAFLIVVVRGLNASRVAMRKSLEEARQAERYKSDFLANMSHEIRTPMNAIIGMCELILRENTLSDSVRENSFNIQASGKSLLSIINDILDFSKIESGRMELVNAEFNIASVLNDVLNMAEARKGAKRLEVLVNVEPDIPRGLIGDEVRIRQVIVNLMTNAIKFTEKGSITLSAKHTAESYGINLIVTVSDTGIGITEENMEKLFTSFRQINTTKNRSVEGTGLGLAISKRLIKEMGGFISAKSTYGVGSEFRFVIPMKVSDPRPFAAVKEPEKVYAAVYFGQDEGGTKPEHVYNAISRRLGIRFKYLHSFEELKALEGEEKFTHLFVGSAEYLKESDYYAAAAERMKVFVVQDRIDGLVMPRGIKPIYKPFYVIPAITALNNESIVLSLNERRGADIRFTAPKARVLIVDDNVVNLKVATGLMQPYNMQILTAQSGSAAIKMLRSRDIDLVFMDHMMAEMDGVEATQIIRNMEGDYYKKLPIIALTANAVNGAREMYVRSGLNDFLAKPIELTALDRVLRTYLPKDYIQPPTKNNFGPWNRRKTDRLEGENYVMLDVEKGISYTGGDREVYREILDLFAQKSDEKRALIQQLFAKRDVRNYVIEVHALKSTSLSIGAVRLSGLAKELEAAGKADGLDTVERKNEELLRLYGEVVDAIHKYLGDAGAKPVQIERENLVEIAAGVLAKYIEGAKAACQGFDGETMARIAGETVGYSFGGEPLADYFGRAAQFADDFEYEAAEKVLAKLEEKMGSGN